jgi:hypothetical protein
VRLAREVVAKSKNKPKDRNIVDDVSEGDD